MDSKKYEIARSSLEMYPVAHAWVEQLEGKNQWKIREPYGTIKILYRSGTLSSNNVSHLQGSYYSDTDIIHFSSVPHCFATAQESFHKGKDIKYYRDAWQTNFARILHKMNDGIRHHMTTLSLYEVLWSKHLLDYPDWTTYINNRLVEYRKSSAWVETDYLYVDDTRIHLVRPKLYGTLIGLKFNNPYTNPYGITPDHGLQGVEVNEPKFVLDHAKKFDPNGLRVEWQPIILTKNCRYSLDNACKIHKCL